MTTYTQIAHHRETLIGDGEIPRYRARCGSKGRRLVDCLQAVTCPVCAKILEETLKSIWQDNQDRKVCEISEAEIKEKAQAIKDTYGVAL